MTRSLRLERVATGVTDRCLYGATVASRSRMVQAWKINFGSVPTRGPLEKSRLTCDSESGDIHNKESYARPLCRQARVLEFSGGGQGASCWPLTSGFESEF